MDQQEILNRVSERMHRERLTQRMLAKQLEVSQGHLSKVLRGGLQRRSRVLRTLEAWVTDSQTKEVSREAEEEALLAAARKAAAGSDQAMPLMTELMRLVDRLRGL